MGQASKGATWHISCSPQTATDRQGRLDDCLTSSAASSSSPAAWRASSSDRVPSVKSKSNSFCPQACKQGHTHQTWAQGGTSGERNDDPYNARVAVKGVVDRSKNDASVHALPASIVLDLWMVERHFDARMRLEYKFSLPTRGRVLTLVRGCSAGGENRPTCVFSCRHRAAPVLLPPRQQGRPFCPSPSAGSWPPPCRSRRRASPSGSGPRTTASPAAGISTTGAGSLRQTEGRGARDAGQARTPGGLCRRARQRRAAAPPEQRRGRGR